LLRNILFLGSIAFAGGSVLSDGDGPSGWTWVLVACLLAASAFFSSTETAIFGLQPIDLRALKEKGGAGPLVDKLRSRPRRLLATILMGNELVNISLSSVCAAVVAQLLPGQAWASVVIVLPVLVLFGEVLPKNLAFRFGRSWALVVARPIWVLYHVVAPLRWLLLQAVDQVIRLFGMAGGNRKDLIKEHHLRSLVDQGLAQGSLRPVEKELVHAVFDFGDLPVSRVMTPRPDIVMVDLLAPPEEVMALIHEHAVSRLPVYMNDRDNVVGILLTKDLLRFLGEPMPAPRRLHKILHAPYFVPTFKPAHDLLDEMRRRKDHMALVVDEHGSLAGLVTIDDLLEELTGQVDDETDSDLDSDVREDPSGAWIVRASIAVHDLADRIAVVLPEGEYATLGGFILAKLGDLPKPGHVLEWEDLLFEVLSVSSRRIQEVRIRSRVPPPTEVPR